MRYGVQECFIDCPTREKGQYLGDLCVAGRAYTAVTRDAAPLKKALEDFGESAFICKGLMAVAPASFMQEIADYSLLFPALVLWAYEFDGDCGFLERTARVLPGMLAYFMQYTDENGLLDGVDEKWNIVDWPENCRDGYSFELKNPFGKGLHNVLNAFWIGFLQAVERIYTVSATTYGFLYIAPVIELNNLKVMLYLIDLLTDNLDELNFATGEDADQFAYGEKTAYAECLEVIQLWSESEKNGLDYAIEKKYPL